jgi:uncharacterized lipoprotein YddW (UPF0748 family)
MRALWVTRWDYRSPDHVRFIADRAAQANFNVLFFQVRGNADAYYRSQLEPWALNLGATAGADPGWDPLQLAIEEAHARGIEVHAWLNVYPAWLGETPPPATEPESLYERFNRLYGDSWVMWDRAQQPMQLNRHYLWANPGHPAVIDHIVHVVRDLLSRYWLDGIHLDNVRYAGWEYSQDPGTLQRVTELRAKEPSLDRKEWQRRQVSNLMAQLHRAIDEIKPGLLLSAAVWPIYKDTWAWWDAGDGYGGFCQDSIGWLRSRIADAICPMLYLSSITTDDGQYEILVRDFAARAGAGAVYPGISTAYEDFGVIARRIDIARQAGLAGQALFAFGQINRRNYWEQFRTGPYATRAMVLQPDSIRLHMSERLRALSTP